MEAEKVKIPEISVIVPVYNKREYLEKTLSSIVTQNFHDFELILIDDGSTDGSYELLQAFDYQNLKVTIIRQKNQGVSTARNNAAALAKGKLLAFLDADDWWDEHFLEKMSSFCNTFSEAKVFSCRYYKVKNGENIPANIGVEEQFSGGYINYYKVYAKTFWVPVNCSFVLIDKVVFLEEGGFNPALKFGEDVHLWLRLAKKYKFAYSPEVLAFSNQDVADNKRALTKKTWKKEEHFAFNLSDWDQKNPDAKLLVDGLKVRSLLPFYLEKQYEAEVKYELKSVDFSKVDNIFYFYYHYPRWIVSFWLQFKKMGSVLKQRWIKAKR